MKYKVLLLSLLCITVSFKQAFTQNPNYALLQNWAAHGAKVDNADSIPKPLRSADKQPHRANVFFVHPTTYTAAGAYKTSANASIADTAINNQTDEKSILFQASCFNQNSVVYAPRYRQTHIMSFFLPTADAKATLDTAYSDIRAAFIYFVNNLNNDMPIILAAHSQGTLHTARLIKEFFEGKPLYNKLVAAYLVGMPVPKQAFTQCIPCQTASSTGCFVSWRTYLQGEAGEAYLKKEPDNSMQVTNPLTWVSDTTLAESKLNEGAVLFAFNKTLKNICNAQVHNNVLWISKPQFAFSFMVKNKLTNYHVGDINLFYTNIRTNVAVRLQQYYKQYAKL